MSFQPKNPLWSLTTLDASKFSTETITPNTATNSSTTSSSFKDSKTSSMNSMNEPRPKMLRVPPNQLPNLHCIAAFSTTNAILTKDAEHKDEEVPPVTQQDITNILSDAVIALKHSLILIIDTTMKKAFINLISKDDSQIQAFFSDGSKELKDSCNLIFNGIFSFISTSEPFTTATGGGHPHLEASHQITEGVTTSLFHTILKHKDVFLRTVLSPVKNDNLTKPIVELTINGSNYDNIWKEAIYTLNVGKSLVSTNTLALKIATIEQKVSDQNYNYTEIDHQITKIATRLGDLKTSEMEQRLKALENDIKIHNLKHLTEGTGKSFSTLTPSEQIKKVRKLVSDQLTNKNASFTAQIISPKAGSRHFEAHAYVKFSSSANKFEFEKNLANFKRSNSRCKLFTSRPAPQPIHSDRDLPDISDIRTRIGMLYNQAVLSAKRQNPNICFKELTETEIDAIQVSQKERHKPFKMYYEFLCPSNNTTFMPYSMLMNPFTGYDFSHTIPNPVTRKHARTDKRYEIRFPPKTYKNSN